MRRSINRVWKKGRLPAIFITVLISPLFLLLISYAQWQPGASAIENLIYIGKSQIAQKSTIGAQSAYTTFQTANASYNSATNEQKVKIRMYLALTRMMDFAVRKEGAGTETLAMFLAKYGATYNGIDVDDLRFFGPVNGENQIVFPVTAPSGDEMRAFLSGPVMNTLNASISDMDSVIALLGAGETKEIISKVMINPEDPSQLNVEIDDGDYYLFRACLKGAKAAALAISAYNMSIDPREVAALINNSAFNFKYVLDRYPDLFTVLTTGGNPSYDGAGKLNESRLIFISAIDDYMIASEKIRNDSDTTPGAEELLYIPDAQGLADEQKFRNYLTQLKYSLSDAMHPAAIFNLDDESQLSVNLNPAFGNGQTPVSLRSILPQFADTVVSIPVAGTMGHGLGNDATLGGIMPEFTQDDWNRLSEGVLAPTGTVLMPTATIIVDGISADWSAITPAFFLTPRNDGGDPGADITTVYLAKDATNYYFRMDTAGLRNDPEQRYDYVLDFQAIPGGAWEVVGDVRVWARYNPEAVWTITTAGGTILEVRLSEKSSWSMYAFYSSGSYTRLHAGAESPAFPESGTLYSSSNYDNTLYAYFNNLTINATVSGNQVTGGSYYYYNPSYSSGSLVSGTKTVNMRWETYASRLTFVFGENGFHPSWSQPAAIADSAMGSGNVVEWKVPVGNLGDISGRFISAEIKRSGSHSDHDAFTTVQVGPSSATGQVNGTVTVPGYDGQGQIFIGVYSALEGYNIENPLAFKMITTGQYSEGMAYSFENLPIAGVIVLIHWDRNSNGQIDAGDYTTFSNYVATSPAGATPVFTGSTSHAPYAMPVLTGVDVSKVEDFGNLEYWSHYVFRAFVPGISPEDVTITVTSPTGKVYTLKSEYYAKQFLGQIYRYSMPAYYGLPSGEYTFEAVDSLGRRAQPVKKMFVPDFTGVPYLSTSIQIDGASQASNSVFYTQANPATTPMTVRWDAVGAGVLYGIQVYGYNDNVLYFTTPDGSETSGTSLEVPAGVLQPDTPYVVIVKTIHPSYPCNYSLSDRFIIYTGNQPTPSFSYANIVDQYLTSTVLYSRTVLFKMPGVAPFEIVSLVIKNSGNEIVGTYTGAPKVDYDFNSPGIFSYTGMVFSPQNGNYTLEATIQRDGTQTVVVSSVIAYNYVAVPSAELSTLSPANNYYFDTTTPAFSWKGQAGTYYRLRIYDANGNSLVYESPWDYGAKTDYSAEVPANMLLRGSSYYWTVQSANTDGNFNATSYPNLLFTHHKEMNRFTILSGADLNASVTGEIRDQLGAIVPGARVEALANDVVIAEATTDMEGKYWLYLPKNTSYTLRVSIPGYAPRTLSVNLAESNLTGRNISMTVGDIDTSVPSIANMLPEGGQSLVLQPEISAVVSNSGPSGIDASSITLYVDGAAVPHAYNPSTGKIAYTPPVALSYDVHTAVMFVKNNAGKSASASWHFVVMGDSTPNAFAFTDQTNVALNTLIQSNLVTVSGISVPAPVSITGGAYSINGGAFTSTAGLLNNGDTVRLLLMSSTNYATTTNATLNIGGISDTFSVTTLANPNAEALYAKFDGLGIWKWDGSGWSQTTASNPDLLVTVGSDLYGTFPGLGIWKYNGTDWEQTTTSVPEEIVGTATTLYGTFTGLGIWEWNGTAWSQTTPSIPQSIIASTSDLYGTFAGMGIWKWDGSTWSNLTTSIPDLLVTSGVKLYGTFPGAGIWLWDGTQWTQATSNTPQMIAGNSTTLYGAFEGAGIWEWAGSDWTQISASNPTQMVASESALYAAFEGVGIRKWDGTTWTTISTGQPAGMVVGN